MAKATFGRGRIEAFSDGVIAIIVTIMVLELHIPETALEGDVWTQLVLPLAPKLIGYALSFLVVAIMWVNHHALMDTVRRVDSAVVWLNLNLLFWMSLIPLVTGFWGDHPLDAPAVSAYGFVLFTSAAAFTLFRRHLMVRERESAELAALHLRIWRKSLLGMGLYGATVPLAWVSPWVSIAIFVLVPAMFFIPDGKQVD
jgi:uncharacterized membrane protein